MDAAFRAVKTVDECVGVLVKTAVENSYTVIITADHGNAEQMRLNGEVFTAHTNNDVPFIVIDDEVKKLRDGSLCDIAPTILDLMGLKKPIQMTGESLIIKESDC